MSRLSGLDILVFIGYLCPNQTIEIMITSDLLSFYSYDSCWERTYYNDETGGYVVTSLMRISEGIKSKNNYSIFLKEQLMCLKLASFGFQIEHLYEYPGISSPDIALHRHDIRKGLIY